MFENMAGPVGFAMHEDRLAQGAKRMRLAEAEQGTRRQTRPGTGGAYRTAIARMLLAVAIRIAPAAALSNTDMSLLAQ